MFAFLHGLRFVNKNIAQVIKMVYSRLAKLQPNQGGQCLIEAMTTETQKDEDINTTFEKLLFAEEIAEEAGYTEGYVVGKNQIIKGYHLGYHRASLLAARLGYYYGIIEYCLNNCLFGEKVVQQAIKLRDILINFPRNNDMSLEILETVEEIKFKFTKLCSLAKIDSFYPEIEKIDF